MRKIRHSNRIPSAVYNFGQVALYSSKAGLTHPPSGFEIFMSVLA